MLNVLFICSRNQWRSPTAERVWSGHPELNVRSAGTGSSARRRVSAADLDWADVVFAMEHRHKDILRERFRAQVRGCPIHVLDVPDQYGFMDEELVAELRTSVGAILGLDAGGLAI